MKKLLSLTLAILMLFSFAACGSAENGDGEETTVDAAAEKVAAYVEANQQALVEPYTLIPDLLASFGMTVDVVAKADGRQITLNFIFKTEISDYNELLKTTFSLLKPSQAYFDSIKEELPELEGIKVRLINKDGDLLFEQSYKPQLKTDTDAQ